MSEYCVNCEKFAKRIHDIRNKVGRINTYFQIKKLIENGPHYIPIKEELLNILNEMEEDIVASYDEFKDLINKSII
jgi:hypothetical protein